jgi:cyanophycinase
MHSFRILACCVMLSAAPTLFAQAKIQPPDKPPTPVPGKLVIVGGGTIPAAALCAFRQAAGGAGANLVVIPTASVSADKEPAQKTIDLWKIRGFTQVTVLHTRSRQQANEPEFAKPLNKASAVWLGGGDQKRITAAYRDTLVEKELHRLLERRGVIGGTSAGAAVMSKLMISGGKLRADLEGGFGFLPGGVVDQHFLKRNRLDRLLDTLHRNPGWFGLGLDEGTAAIVEGRTITIVGSSMAVLCQRSTPDGPASCRVMRASETADLIEVSRQALERARGVK